MINSENVLFFNNKSIDLLFGSPENAPSVIYLDFTRVTRRSFSIQVQVKIRSTAWLAEQTQLQAIAQAGIFHGLQATLPDKTQRWRLNNHPHELDWQGYQLRIRLLSEQGRIDLNVAPRILLVGLFKSVLQNTGLILGPLAK